MTTSVVGNFHQIENFCQVIDFNVNLNVCKMNVHKLSSRYSCI